MNERIQKLIEQATETVDVSDKLGMPGTDLVFNKEKFAQLIVRDCISQIAMIGVSNYNDNDVSWTVDKSIENIRKHFGVEE